MRASDEDVRETYAHFGLAVYLAQVLEHEIVNAMVILRLPQRGTLTRQDIDGFMDRQFENTLGKLIRNLRSEIALPANLEAVLGDALRTRNWLCHDYFRERSADFMTWTGCERMIVELKSAQELFHRSNRALASVMEPIAIRYGVTSERVEAAYRELLKEAGVSA